MRVRDQIQKKIKQGESNLGKAEDPEVKARLQKELKELHKCTDMCNRELAKK